MSQCVFRDHCFDSIEVLLRNFVAWQLRRHAVPCGRDTLEELLLGAGLVLGDGVVHGLLLKADIFA
jgi:hypothetical protein